MSEEALSPEEAKNDWDHGYGTVCAVVAAFGAHNPRSTDDDQRRRSWVAAACVAAYFDQWCSRCNDPEFMALCRQIAARMCSK